MNTNTIQNPVPILQQPKSNIVTNPLINPPGIQDLEYNYNYNYNYNYKNTLFNKIKVSKHFILLGVTLLILGIVSSFFCN
jgi:hypothetical protein